MIYFNIPPFAGKEFEYMKEAVDSMKICGDGDFSKRCGEWIQNRFGTPRAMLTTSGSSALDMAALLCDLHKDDEVILPSFTFSSTANAFVLAGAKLVFVDIRPDTMNIDENKIEAAITEKTKVIVPVHYAGVSCEMDTILKVAKRHNLKVVEDAAQGMMSTYKGRALGTIGDFGCYSFHETKNYSMGEGGAILINNENYIERAEILREKGTNRTKFWKGQVDKYTWVDFGDSYLQSDLNAAYLWAQLEQANVINKNRIKTWQAYNEAFRELSQEDKIIIPTVPEGCEHNAHMYYIKCKNLEERTKFISFMKKNDIMTVFHYIPLHSSPAGVKYGRFNGIDEYTTQESEKLVRLPMYYGMTSEDRCRVIDCVKDFFGRGV